MRVLHLLQHFQLIVDHLLVTADILFQDDLHRDLALWAVGLANDTIGSGTQGLSKLVAGPAIACSAYDRV